MKRTDLFFIKPSRIIHFVLYSSSSFREIVGIYQEEDKFLSFYFVFSSEEDSERFVLFIGSSSVAFERFRGFRIFFSSSSIESGSSFIASTFPEIYLL